MDTRMSKDSLNMVPKISVGFCYEANALELIAFPDEPGNATLLRVLVDAADYH